MVNVSAEKSWLPKMAAMSGVMMSATSAAMTAPNAMPMTTATARSTTFPRKQKCLELLEHRASLPCRFALDLARSRCRPEAREVGAEGVVELGGKGASSAERRPQAGGGGQGGAHETAAAASPRYGSARSSAGGGGSRRRAPRPATSPRDCERQQVAAPGERFDQEAGGDVGGRRPREPGEAAVEVVGPARQVLPASARPRSSLVGK